MKHFAHVLCLLLLYCNTSTAQWCASEQIFMQRTQSDPGLLRQRDEQDKLAVENIGASASNGARAGNAVITIPVVVYVIHDGTPATNITMERIQSQMQQLNVDFAPHSIQFCFAKKDVIADTLFRAATGDSLGVFRINSQYTNVDINGTDGQLKALSRLSPVNYMRMFVVNGITPANVGGYAYYPGGGGQLDGIVVRANMFGSSNYCNSCTFYTNYNKGSVTTHEVGHYLGLYHTFQGGCAADSTQPACQLNGDRVCDTPPSPGTFGCPSPAPFSCGGNTAILTNNYMEYTHDGCKNAFTAGQGARMAYHAGAYRGTLIGIQNLINTGQNCASLEGLHASISATTFNGCQGRAMQFKSFVEQGYTYRWYFGDGDSATGTTVTHTYSAEGRYVLQLVAENSQAQINESQTTTVFVTPCKPAIKCSYNVWRGSHTSMAFGSGEPVPVCDAPTVVLPVFPGMFFTDFYRCDTSGNRLFGIIPGTSAVRGYLFNAANQYNLADTVGLFDNPVLFPCPGSSNRFCFFSALNRNPFDPAILQYSIIQSLNGVVSIVPGKHMVNVATPVPLSANRYFIAAIPACSPDIFWVLVYSSGEKAVWVYRFDTNHTFTLNQQYALPGNIAAGGGLHISLIPAPNGKEIALNVIGGLIRMPFNPSTGQILSHTYLSSPSFGTAPLGICYSPNGRFLYRTSTTGNDVLTIYQLDMQSADPVATRKLVATVYGYKASPKIGPDKKMYFAVSTYSNQRSADFHLAVINYPDRYEADNNEVGFNRMGPNVIPEGCSYSGLDNITPHAYKDFHSAYDCDWRPGVPRMFASARNSCLQYKFTADDCFNASWNFGDPASGNNDTSTLTTANHTYSQPGHYLVTLTSHGYVFTDSVFIDVPATELVASPLQMCPVVFANYSVKAPETHLTYRWSITNGLPADINNSSNADINWQSSPGQIQLVAYNQITGCADTIRQTITYNTDTNLTALLTVQQGSSTCNGVVINLQTENTPSVLWYRNGVQVATGGLTYTATQSGQYTAIVNNGCSERHSNQVQVLVGGPQISGPVVALCAQQTFTYSIAAVNGAIYNWIIAGGTITGGQGTNTVQVKWTTGQHELVAEQANPGTAACRDTLSISAVLCTDIEDVLTDKWAIYPNPANNVLNVEYLGANPTGAELKLVNMLGQVALQQTIAPQGGELKQQLNLQGLAPGIYTLYVQHGQARVMQRVVKK